jgi:hypothetical protein
MVGTCQCEASVLVSHSRSGVQRPAMQRPPACLPACRRRMSSLVEDWASRAALKQRRGRAGRVRPGLCFGLYTRKRFEQQMRSYEVPEMARVPLEELVLQIHLMDLVGGACWRGRRACSAGGA